MGTVHGSPFLPLGRASERVRDGAGEHDIVVVGAPVAAAQAASMFLVGLSGAFTLPIVLILGGAGGDDRARLVSLQAHCALPVRIVDDRDPIVAGRIHVAPADYHLLVEDEHFALSTEAPQRGARPSLDVLFESVADAFGARAVCVLLGRDEDCAGDGRAGAAKIGARGGLVIVENTTTAAVGQRDLDPLPAATVLHLSQIAPFVSTLAELEGT